MTTVIVVILAFVGSIIAGFFIGKASKIKSEQKQREREIEQGLRDMAVSAEMAKQMQMYRANTKVNGGISDAN